MSRALNAVWKAGVALGMVFLAACSNEESKARGDYVAGCMQSGTDKAACDCTYDKMLKFYTFKELKAMSQSSRRIPPDFMDNVVKAVLICKKEMGR
ncbi:MAG: hypothetical protein V4542_06090 [Pseudomonadota bacterium]